MPNDIKKKEWDEYVAGERRRIEPLLNRAGVVLDEYQPQTLGERYLTRPVGGGRKVVFFGRASDGRRVVLKTSSEPLGTEELEWERQTRKLLDSIGFAYQTLYSPAEISFDKAHGILITEYIEQDKPFLERPLAEQFALALAAFKAQESAHATTSRHWSALQKQMSTHSHHIKSGEYRKVAEYANDILPLLRDDSELYHRLETSIDMVTHLVNEHTEILLRYDGFLTHWDFIPQNFRIRGNKLYLLDHTSIRFGNKYEGWARFVNFMELYNPPLARALVEYVRDNRTPEESVALKVMRAYRLLELIRYYASWLEQTEGNDKKLAEARVAFWTTVLESVLEDKDIPAHVVDAYKQIRDTLRSEDEKKRQVGLH